MTNNITDEGTGIHWHGILQKDNQAYDGVPGVSMCPIAPGATFTYNFPAELYGSSYWHSHYSAQLSNGLSGPIIIYGPNATSYDIDLGPAQLSDWYHDSYNNLLGNLSVPLSETPQYPYSKNVLINGKNPFDCSKADGKDCDIAPISRFNLQDLQVMHRGQRTTARVGSTGHSLRLSV